ncbi:SDR family NAD(P)-dependent oxidoreductase [Geodermatophilus sp. CPCC 206100]|uniref:SDR family NAD(P)-dependent oxidoreductase n=1 Tax=Geodermatophilus sp. CPCC 206100 TaxID=3020054 RepID=UPI003B003889
MGSVVVTGGTSGIGLGIATALVAAGRDVAVLARDPGRGELAAQALDEAGSGRGLVLPADVTDESALARAVATVAAELGPPEGLVTAAGRLARGSALELPVEDFRAAWETNVLGTWLAVRAVLPGMLERGFGRIVTIGSVLGTVGTAERGGYAATKGAVHALTRCIALEVAGTGVTVNCVAPGPIGTPMNQVQGDEEVQQALTAKLPVRRWGTPADVSAAVLPLLAEGSAFVTGSVVHVDGGYTAQ